MGMVFSHILHSVQDNPLLNHCYHVMLLKVFFNAIQHIQCDVLLHAGYRYTLSQLVNDYFLSH